MSGLYGFCWLCLWSLIGGGIAGWLFGHWDAAERDREDS